MAPRAKQVAHDAAGAEEIYAVAKANAETQLAAMREEFGAIREESQALGALQAIETTIAFQEMLRAITLQRIKQNKEYRNGGLTWVEFCESLGLAQRTVDLMLEDLRPIMETFSAKIADFTGMPFSKIRLLGKQISANLAEIKDGCLVYGDETIPLTPDHVEDIQALIDRVAEEARTAKEEAESEVRTAKRLVKSKEDVIKKQEKDLARFEKTVAAKGLTPEEDSLLGKIDELGVLLNGYSLQVENVMIALRENPLSNPIAAFVTLLDNIRLRTNTFRETVVAELAPAGMFPDEEWQPPVGKG